MDKCCMTCKWWIEDKDNHSIGGCVCRPLEEIIDEEYEDTFTVLEKTSSVYVCEEYEPKSR